MTAAPQQVELNQALLEYLLASSEPLPDPVHVAWEKAEEMGRGSMQVAPDQAILLRFLLRTIGARRVLEIGTFLGLSALVMAEAVGPEGSVICLDKSPEWAQQARSLWDEAGVSERIEVVVGDAHESVRSLSGEFDAVFVDADKGGYLDYLERVTPLLRSGGLLLVDNTLWDGRVADRGEDSPDTLALRRFNDVLASHPGYEVAMVAVGDGFTLARKR